MWGKDDGERPEEYDEEEEEEVEEEEEEEVVSVIESSVINTEAGLEESEIISRVEVHTYTNIYRH